MRKLGSLEPVLGVRGSRHTLTYVEVLTRRPMLEARLLQQSTRTNQCWIWNGCVGSHGYGDMYVPKYSCITTHVLSWMLYRGEVPLGKLVLHTCDNHRCWNPTHLFAGTHADNTKDMVVKERSRPGNKGRGLSGVPYVHWNSRRGGWKAFKNDTKFGNDRCIESRVFRTIDEARAWAEARGWYA